MVEECKTAAPADPAAASGADAGATPEERQQQVAYWKEHSTGTVEAMMLDSNAAMIDKLERPEVLSLLGSVSGKKMVELGAGIGRFTGKLAEQAAHVVALDFMDTSIQENRRMNGHMNNIDFRVGDVTELQLDTGCCDCVFSNWLLMYLGDKEVQALAVNMLRWVVEGGCVFFRESCFKQSGDKARRNNPTHYRNPRDYFRIFDGAQLQQPDGRWARFELQFCKCIDTYVRVKRNQNQICWKWTKVVSDTPRGPSLEACSFRHFLDAGQYSTASLLRYERVFGQGYVSCGGEATTKELCALLGLKAGEKVLDVGCGVGGSTYTISEQFGVHCHGLDLSVNSILLALERASERPGADVTFEVADCTVRDYAEGSFDVIYCRDVLLYVKETKALLEKFSRWLRPGGRLLITDYCRSAAEPSEGFASYMSSRQYCLHTIEEYEAMVASSGFAEVAAEDRTEQFIRCLKSELEAFEQGKEAFVRDFSQQDYGTVVASWRGKIERASQGEQKWAMFRGQKPSVAK